MEKVQYSYDGTRWVTMSSRPPDMGRLWKGVCRMRPLRPPSDVASCVRGCDGHGEA